MILPKYPLRVELEVTDKCNLKCVYCYAKPNNNLQPSTKDIKYFLEKTKAEADPSEMVLLGGEPFMRDDALDIFRFASKVFDAGSVAISTNGTLLYKLPQKQLNQMRALVEENRMSFQISLDSTNPTINNRTRGLGELTLKGIDILEKNRINFAIGIVITKFNYESLSKTMDYLIHYNSIVSINLEQLQPARMITNYQGLQVDASIMQSIHTILVPKIRSQRSDIHVISPIEDSAPLSKTPLLNSYDFKVCTAGLLRAGVLTTGEVVPCPALRDVHVGNLYKNSWSEIWENSKSRFLRVEGEGRQCALVNLPRSNDNVGINKQKCL